MDWQADFVMVLRLGLATAFGAALGWQRERSGHTAGTRTFSLVALGACAFGLVSIAGGDNDRTRVAAQVATGIGFLGAGVILRGSAGVHGLTTAATIWTTAALGLLVAFGQYAVAAVATGGAVLILYLPHPNDTHDQETDGSPQPPVPPATPPTPS
jgi:putative Mg2+ transporter-C (MgtC) family protein